jgi:glyoxylase-like metal-dependent hydrolase (beta-lactamase superfamily II)
MAVIAVASANAAEEEETQIDGLTVLRLDDQFYMIAGDGQNIGVQVGPEGPVLVNAGTEAGSAALLAAVKKITPLPIRMIIDTSGDPEAVGGNAAVAAAGLGIYPAGVSPGALIWAQQNVLLRMGGADAQPTYPSSGWPTDAYLEPSYDLYFNGGPIVMFHEPAASSDGDSTVLFRRSDVVMAGGVMDMTRFPVIDLAHGGSINGEVTALNHLLQLAVGPAPLIYTAGDGTYVVPAHGRVGDQWEVIDYRDMVVTIRDTVAYLMKQHMSLEQIETAHPAKAYEPRYGSDTGSWTTNMFIEAIYKSLLASKKTR